MPLAWYHACRADTLQIKQQHSGELIWVCQVCGVAQPGKLKRGPQRRPAAVRRSRKNPAARLSGPDEHEARALFEAFSGEHPGPGKKMRIPGPPKVGLAIGPVLLIGYETIRDGKREQYIHKFQKHARPLLVISHDGRSVLMLGGAFTFTERGFEDLKP